MPMEIVSVSRRTDIPALYMDWFMGRVREGYAVYPNPFGGTLHRVSLLPQEVHSLVFWSKHYGPLLPHLGKLLDMGYATCFHYTINHLPPLLEPHVPPWELSVRIFGELVSRTSPRQVFWRFDPIVLTEELDHGFYLSRFAQIGSRLQGLTQRCYFSFVTPYGKAKAKMRRVGIPWREPSAQEKEELAWAMARLARDFGMELMACCQEELVGDGIHKARCVDGELLSELSPNRPPVVTPRPTRPGCGCTASRDIGMYDTCPMGCMYCYANQSRELALSRMRRHDPLSETLLPQRED
jgi:hypothetical protein